MGHEDSPSKTFKTSIFKGEYDLIPRISICFSEDLYLCGFFSVYVLSNTHLKLFITSWFSLLLSAVTEWSCPCPGTLTPCQFLVLKIFPAFQFFNWQWKGTKSWSINSNKRTLWHISLSKGSERIVRLNCQVNCFLNLHLVLKLQVYGTII